MKRHIDVRYVTHGIAGVLRDHFEANRPINQDNLFSCRLADVMLSMGLLSVNDDESSFGYHAYIWTDQAKAFYDRLQSDGYYT